MRLSITAALLACQAIAFPTAYEEHKQTLEEAGELWNIARTAGPGFHLTAHWARHVIDHRADGIATLASIIPSDFSIPELSSRPIAFLEYYASGPTNGSLYMFLMPVSTTVHNVLNSTSKAATVTLKDEEGERRSKGRGATDRARITLWGNVVLLPAGTPEAKVAHDAYIKFHPDAAFYAGPRAFPVSARV
jgi:hypothetical protein